MLRYISMNVHNPYKLLVKCIGQFEYGGYKFFIHKNVRVNRLHNKKDKRSVPIFHTDDYVVSEFATGFRMASYSCKKEAIKRTKEAFDSNWQKFVITRKEYLEKYGELNK